MLLYVLLLSAFSCTKKNPEKYTQYLNGYWEIKTVILADGSKKQYRFNQNIDFIEIKDSTGIRKKVQPKLDNSFITTNDSELFTLKIEDDSLRLYYKTSLATWKETIISIKENNMTIKNETGNVYFYSRYKKIEL
ncbi:lipocalin family protein [Aquimarina longa]|uniref:lipocalin family protein n=1 Tax=Aquimarina longa TaxID=1080221 RepID=UPI0011E029E8|nr:lipocalin family protein [Aquimarina longa]